MNREVCRICGGEIADGEWTVLEERDGQITRVHDSCHWSTIEPEPNDGQECRCSCCGHRIKLNEEQFTTIDGFIWCMVCYEDTAAASGR